MERVDFFSSEQEIATLETLFTSEEKVTVQSDIHEMER